MRKNRICAIVMSIALTFGTLACYAAPTASPAPSASPAASASPAPSTSPEAEQQKQSMPEPHAKAALLVDRKSGNVIYSAHAGEKMYPASLTKIMTALLALEKGNLSDVLTVTDTALADITYLHSRIDLKAGGQLTLENLLTALLVSSANDAANVIAEYISGDIPTFVELMNTRAKELGMTNTHFVNPHGFHDDNHYTTANDLYLVMREALKNPKFCEIVKTKTAKIPATNLAKERTISSTNHLISRYRNTFHYYPYATGVKTGSTTEAGNCLIATAEKNGISLLSVVLGCENADQNENAYSFVDTKAMFEYVFNNYKSVTVAQSTDVIADSKVYEAKDSTRVALSPSKDIVMLLPSDYKAEEIKSETKLADSISAPIEKGALMGSVTYSFRGETVASADLYAANEVRRDNLLHFMHLVGRVVFSPFVIIPILVICALLVMNAYTRTKRRKVRRRYMKSQHRPQQGRTSARTNTASRRQPARRPPSRRTGTKRPPSGNAQRRRPVEEDPWDKYR